MLIFEGYKNRHLARKFKKLKLGKVRDVVVDFKVKVSKKRKSSIWYLGDIIEIRFLDKSVYFSSVGSLKGELYNPKVDYTFEFVRDYISIKDFFEVMGVKNDKDIKKQIKKGYLKINEMPEFKSSISSISTKTRLNESKCDLNTFLKMSRELYI